MIQSTGYCRGQGSTLPGRRVVLLVALVLLITVFSAGTVTPQDPGEIAGNVTSAAEQSNEVSSDVPVAEPGDPGMPLEATDDQAAPMVLIPAGEFVMGSSDRDSEDDERPQHRVRLDALYMDKHEVTTAQYDKFLEATGHTRPDFWPYEELSEYGERPVVGVDWHGAQAYCEWAGKRLPTEAEWEFAARGKDGRRYPWGDTAPTPELANYGKNWSHKFYKNRLEVVGIRGGNQSPFGVRDMAGNVWEWVADWYDAKYYASSPDTNPPGPPNGSLKVSRGGSWNFAAKYMRAAGRLRFPPRYRAADLGFRCARDAEPRGKG